MMQRHGAPGPHAAEWAESLGGFNREAADVAQFAAVNAVQAIAIRRDREERRIGDRRHDAHRLPRT